MRYLLASIFIFHFFFFNFDLLGATFTSSQNGAWDDCQTWGFGGSCTSTEGVTYPSRSDNVILTHNVTVNNVADNNIGGGTIPNSLGGNVGVFPGSSSTHFYHTGSITVNNGGVITSTVGFLNGGNLVANSGGIIDIQADFVVAGNLVVNVGAVLSVGDDFTLTGFSSTVLNTSNPVTDDFYLDHEDALLTGSGEITVNEIKIYNDGGDDNIHDQVTGITINCRDGNCCNEGYCTSDVSGGSFLPVEFMDVSAKRIDGSVMIKWATATETDNELFEIQRSKNGVDWKKIGKIAGAGNSTVIHKYEFVDENPIDVETFYRIKQVDFDGKFSFSNSMYIDANGKANLHIWPNPSRNIISISNLDAGEVIEVTISTLEGRRVPTTIQNNEIVLTDCLSSSGIYFLNIHRSSKVDRLKFIYLP